MRVRKNLIEYALAMAPANPDLFAYTLMQRSGYQAIILGELVHIVDCPRVSCTHRGTEGCYQELPVTCNNASYFLTRKTHMLVRKDTQLDCNPLLPAGYQIQGVWYYFNPESMVAPTPKLISTKTESEWKCNKSGNLSTDEIYSQSDSIRLRDRIMDT